MQDSAMGNQQVTACELAWLAGIWDGEGTVSLRRSMQHRGNRGPQFSPRVSMVNTNTLIVEKVMDILNRLGIAYYFREKDQGGFPGSRRQCWIVAIETLVPAAQILVAIRPFLIGKAFQADCLLRFVESRLAKKQERKGKRSVNFNTEYRYTAEELGWLEQVQVANGDPRGTSEAIREAALSR